MPDERQFEAGVFALAAEGWVIVKRRTFGAQDSALRWLRRSTDSLARKNPSRRIRGSVVAVGDWLTLEKVAADHEGQRKAGNPEFDEIETTQLVVNGQVRASYTARQGQFLAFIYYYTKLNVQPPAEADMARHFKVSAPVVHEMVLTLAKKGLIARAPGAARSIRVLLPREQLPDLE